MSLTLRHARAFIKLLKTKSPEEIARIYEWARRRVSPGKSARRRVSPGKSARRRVSGGDWDEWGNYFSREYAEPELKSRNEYADAAIAAIASFVVGCVLVFAHSRITKARRDRRSQEIFAELRQKQHEEIEVVSSSPRGQLRSGESDPNTIVEFDSNNGSYRVV